MDNCNDNGKCVDGKCECNKNYIGADCSVKKEGLKGKFTLGPWEWWHFKGDKGVIYEIHKSKGKNNNPVEMYTRENELPSTFFFDSHYVGTEYYSIVKG